MKIFIAIFLCTISLLLDACQENLSQVATFQDGSAIIFSENNEQPPTIEAVIWSCANSTEKSVTDWYISEFGFNDDNGTFQGIINLQLTFIPKELRDDFKLEFYKNFRRIASTSVGRTLLYRLLVAIRNDENCSKYKTIQVRKSANNSFSKKGTIEFCPSNDKLLSNAVGLAKGNVVSVILESRTDDVGLFHEILHWYHCLRDYERFLKEINIGYDVNGIGISSLDMSMGYENRGLWVNKGRDSINMEEFRTEMGYTVPIFQNTGNLVYSPEITKCDDIGENLYRICTGQIVRYGHKGTGLVSRNAIVRAWESYAVDILPYHTGYLTE